MKRYAMLIALCLSCFTAAAAELSEEVLEHLKESVKIGGIGDDTFRNEDGEKIELLKFYTFQNEDDDYEFRLRVTVELSEKSKKVVFAQLMRGQGELDPEYTGEDNWRFELPQGNLKRPKMTAYAIQYGVLHEGNFIVLVEEFDDVDSLEELTERTTVRAENKPVIKHQYTFRDLNAGNAGNDESGRGSNGDEIQSEWDH